ncbi:DNA-formamidopyrimidine glycosylase [bacterium]|nr:DNA-formamidopyrimidine glycosylase [bacterium]
MPELPEVETIRRGLEGYLPGRKIAKVKIGLPKLLINADVDDFSRAVVGETFTSVRRKGKILILDLEKHSILVRLGMTGQLTFHNSEDEEATDKHTHIIVKNDDDSSLRYRDIRQFGKWYLYSTEELVNCRELNDLGPDPFQDEYTLEALTENLCSTSRAIKTALLDQKIVSGLGNIYADEVLFDCGVNPNRSAKLLTEDEIKSIYVSIPKILQKSIDNRGTTFSDYRDANGEKGDNVAYLNVYGRAGQVCGRCGEVLVKATIGGRTSTWCPQCQR